ncbi:RNA-directed RNA polymerase [Phyllosticta citribraziliensis]|uniref:RNA-directed RNA polymerase n=1 Tax=Phyllosticta citribraziliensis TaxID=989973 RepID=A0ABR1LXG0_9PEZI
MAPRLQNVTLDRIPSVSYLYQATVPIPPPLRNLRPWTASPVAANPNAAFNEKIGLINADVTSMTIDAIVNAANVRLAGGGGIDGAIHYHAGHELHQACVAMPTDKDGARCRTGEAKITDGFELPCKKIIHTPGPIWYDIADKTRAAALLRSCYRSSLDLAVQNGCRSIVFPPISTNIYGYPRAEAADVALGAVRGWLEEKGPDVPIDAIVFTNVDMPDMTAYLHFIPKYFPHTSPLAEDDEAPEAPAEKKH